MPTSSGDPSPPTASSTGRGRRARALLWARRALASIRTRLVGAMVVMLVLALGGTALGVNVVLRARVDDRIQDQHRQEVEELRLFAEQGLDPDTGEPFGLDVRRLVEVYVDRSVPTLGEVIVAYDDGAPFARTVQETPYRVDLDEPLAEAWRSVTSPASGTVDTPAGPFDYVAVPVRGADADEVVLLVGSFRQVVAAEVDQTVAVTAGVALVALLLGVATAVGLARRILRPLASVTEAAAALGESDLSSRLAGSSSHDEIGELTGTFNGMLDRLEVAFEEQRRFMDDAGHELRTPITVVRGHLELLAHDAPAAERAETRELLLDELDRMRRIVDDLLVLAQRDRPDFVVAGPFELDELTTSVLRRATALSDSHRWRLDTVGVGAASGDEQRLAQALLQLAQNAARHTPAGTTVQVGSAHDGAALRLWVSDDGPGIAPGDRVRIFERFERGSDGPRRTDGAGLGLAVVAAVAEAHGGTVVLEDSAAGGARFELRVPQPPVTGGRPRPRMLDVDDPPASLRPEAQTPAGGPPWRAS